MCSIERARAFLVFVQSTSEHLVSQHIPTSPEKDESDSAEDLFVSGQQAAAEGRVFTEEA